MVAHCPSIGDTNFFSASRRANFAPGDSSVRERLNVVLRRRATLLLDEVTEHGDATRCAGRATLGGRLRRRRYPRLFPAGRRPRRPRRREARRRQTAARDASRRRQECAASDARRGQVAPGEQGFGKRLASGHGSQSAASDARRRTAGPGNGYGDTAARDGRGQTATGRRLRKAAAEGRGVASSHRFRNSRLSLRRERDVLGPERRVHVRVQRGLHGRWPDLHRRG